MSDRESIHTDRPPTIRDIVHRGIAFNVHALSLVMPPQQGKEAGIFVLMLTPAAVRKVGRLCEEFAREADHETPHDKTEVLQIDPDTSLKWFFTWLEETKQRWAYGKFVCAGYAVLTAGFLGTERCQRLAQRLTACGVPTSLT